MKHLKRLGRWLLLFTTLVSLLLCTAAIGMWIRSYWWSDEVYLGVGDDICGAGSRLGKVGLSYIPRLAVAGGTGVRSFQFGESPKLSDHFVFRYTEGSFWSGPAPGGQATPMFVSHVLTIPHWSVVVVLGILPAIGIWRWFRRRRAKEGMCRNCGYDLRATPERCPECGAVPKAAPGAED